MATVKDTISILKRLAPEEHAYNKEYDNVGLLFGDDNARIDKVLICLDTTDSVIDEAIKLKCNLIISHHPFIYMPLKRVNAEDLIGRKILKAAKHGINIYSSHTNLDFVKDGINDFLAVKLGLKFIKPLEPYISSDEGFGRIGELPNRVSAQEIKKNISVLLNDNFVRIVGSTSTQIKKVAIINGGGGGDTKYIDMALGLKADCLITADVKHHVAVYARELNFPLIECQHYTMEHAYLARLIQLLKLELKAAKYDIELLQSQEDKNPRSFG